MVQVSLGLVVELTTSFQFKVLMGTILYTLGKLGIYRNVCQIMRKYRVSENSVLLMFTFILVKMK